MTVILLPIATGVGLMEVYGILSGSSFSSNITFYNVREELPILFVEKKVNKTDGTLDTNNTDYFLFELKLNGAPAEFQNYDLYDLDGNTLLYSGGQLLKEQIEIDSVSGENTYIYTDVDTKEKFSQTQKLIGNELKTDKNGQFRLRANQRAKFYDLTLEDKYEVKEILESSSSYQQISPAAGTSKTGVITHEGKTETFVNANKDSDGGDGSSGNFEVRKDIVYPEDYELPETPDFSFLIKMDDKPFANQAYTVKDSETDEVISSDNTTDEKGIFTLKGNTYAVFSNVPDDVDYYVEELWDDSLEEAGWTNLGDLVQEGATVSTSEIVSFTNKLAVFGVSKKMYDGVSVEDDDIFTFQIVDGDGKAFGEAVSYYLYDKNKMLVDDEIRETATDGTFTLGAGETAVFFGLDPGTEYGVKETDSGQYVRMLPANGPGYFGQTVQSDSVAVWEFFNSVVTEKLLVEKIIEDNSEDGSAPDAEFSFRITKQDSNGEFVPVSGARYNTVNATGTSTYAADTDGVFTLKAWQTARFLNLKNDEVYRIEELQDVLILETVTGGTTFEYKYEAEAGSATFKLVELDPETEEYLDVQGASYNILGADGVLKYVPNADGSSPLDYPQSGKDPEPIEYTTDDEGRFVLQAGETAIFNDMDENADYAIQKVSDLSVEGFTVGGSSVKEVTIEDDNAHIRFVNVYEETDEPYIAIQKKTAKGNPLSGAELELYRKADDGSEEVLHKWVSSQTPEEIQVEPGTYFIRETKAPEGFEVAEDVEIVVAELDNPHEIQTFEMTDIRDTDVPTGAEWLKTTWGKLLIAVIVILVAAGLTLLGVYWNKRKNAH